MAGHAPDLPVRRQLSLLVPEAQRARVDDVRQRLDPRQHALIPAHVTLCREDELPAPEILIPRLAGLPPVRLTLGFDAPQELPDGCVLLRPVSGGEAFDALRRAVLGPAARPYGPHLTLRHPRNATGPLHDLATIARDLAGLAITFDTVSLIEQRGGDPWRVIAAFPPGA